MIILQDARNTFSQQKYLLLLATWQRKVKIEIKGFSQNNKIIKMRRQSLIYIILLLLLLKYPCVLKLKFYIHPIPEIPFYLYGITIIHLLSVSRRRSSSFIFQSSTFFIEMVSWVFEFNKSHDHFLYIMRISSECDSASK